MNSLSARLGTKSTEANLLKQGFSLKLYLIEVAKLLRQHEAERARGDLATLEALEHTTDATLLRKWGWISTIVGAGFAFLVLPLTIGLIQRHIPEWLNLLLWAVAKTSMGMSMLMFAASVYFTVGLNSD